MPNITNFAFAKLTETDSGLEKEELTIIRPNSIPGRDSFAIEFSLVLDGIEKDYSGFIIMYKPNGEKLVKTEPFEINREMFSEVKANMDDYDDNKDEKILTGITLGINFEDVLFETSGLYKAALYLNEDKLGEFGIAVAAKRR